MDYLDFELEIGLGTGKEYPVAVLDSPGGEARELMRFPFDQLALESRLKDLEIALLRSGGTRRRVPTNEENSVLGFGQTLFDALFTGEIRSRYDVSYESASRDGLGLRLKLRIQDPSLASLPWEFLYDPRAGDFISLSRNTPLVRYLELPQRIPPLKISPPLRILGVVSSPTDLPALDLAREKERVTRALARASEQGLIELSWMRGETWRDLQGEMQGGPWHVLHFVGHGGFDKLRDEGFICVAEDDGTSRFLYATDLARLLADHRTLRLAVLNACEGARGGGVDVISSTSSILVRRGLPAVLAMQYEITDAAAIEFSRGFYEALANGLPVDAAVSEARKAVSLEVANTVEWGTPVLTMRTPDGVLFDVTSAPIARPVVASAPAAAQLPTGVSSAPADRVERAARPNDVREVGRAPEAVSTPSSVVTVEHPQRVDAPAAEKKVRPKASKLAWLVLAISLGISVVSSFRVANAPSIMYNSLDFVLLLFLTPGLIVAAIAAGIRRGRASFIEQLAAALTGVAVSSILWALVLGLPPWWVEDPVVIVLFAIAVIGPIAGVVVLNRLRGRSRK